MSAPKCLTCKGAGLIVRNVPSSRYACGFHSEALVCETCCGTGRYITDLTDHKVAASGEGR